MTDLSQTIIAKSDQLNSDDLIGRTLTIKITRVSAAEGEQPVAINFEGDNGRPYKPCKSMRRVLVMAWGSEGKAYVGRSLTLYRDESVVFGGIAVGGIRISHMSHIDGPLRLMLTATRAKKKPFAVDPLIVPTATVGNFDEARRRLHACGSKAQLGAVWVKLTKAEQTALLLEKDALKAELPDREPGEEG